MKTIRFQLFHRMVQFTTIITAICCIGCANVVDDVLNDIDEPSNGDSDGVDNQSIIADMPIQGIEVLLAESDPVQVAVVVTGWLPDSCTAHHETHQERIGDTITIQITTIRPRDLACATVVTEYQEKVSIGTLPAGDYKVIVNDVEGEFRVD
jgi:inhibitor of cysteine peptidase